VSRLLDLALRAAPAEGGGQEGGDHGGYALVSGDQWNQLVAVVNTLSRNQRALADGYSELRGRVDELGRRLHELHQQLANIQGMVLTASERLTTAVIAEVIRSATARALEGVAGSIVVNLEPLQRSIEERLAALEGRAEERDRRLSEQLAALGNALSELGSSVRALAERLERMARGQASLAERLGKSLDELGAALEAARQQGGADVSSRLDSIASDVKALQVQVRALGEQLSNLHRAVARIKEDIIDQLAGEEEEGRGRR